MQATTARCLPGGIGRSPLLKELANSALLRSSSSVTVMDRSLRLGGVEEWGPVGHRAMADPGAAFLDYLGSRVPGQPQVTTRP